MLAPSKSHSANVNSAIRCEVESNPFVFVLLGYSINQSDPESQSNYRAGFNDCAAKVCSFVENQPSVDSKLREQILESLTASYSYNIHTYQTRVNTNTSMCYSPGPAVYLSSLQTVGESPCSYASTPPPSPPSSAFSPYDRNEAAMLSELSNNFIDNHSTADIERNIAEPCTNPVQCHLPIWRPWISSTQEGQI